MIHRPLREPIDKGSRNGTKSLGPTLGIRYVKLEEGHVESHWGNAGDPSKRVPDLPKGVAVQLLGGVYGSLDDESFQNACPEAVSTGDFACECLGFHERVSPVAVCEDEVRPPSHDSHENAGGDTGLGEKAGHDFTHDTYARRA
jgi:hypothetical protein